MSDIMKTRRTCHFLVVIVLLGVIFVLYYMWQDWFPWLWAYFSFECRYNVIGISTTIPILYSVIISRWRVPVMVWGVSMLAVLPVLVYYHPYNRIPILINVAMLLIPIAIVVIVGVELEWRAKQKKVTIEREQERQTYMTQIFRAQEDERSRIAQELHDDTIQTLMVIASNARSLLSSRKFQLIPAVRENLEWTGDTSLRLAEDLRRLSLDLRPSILDTMGLLPALNWLVSSFGSGHNIDGQFEVDGEIRTLEPEVDVAIFRIVQEALSNVGRHSGATKVCVRVKYLLRLLKLSIKDNGTGFTLPKEIASYSHEGKIGLLGMHQRARSLGGTLTVDTKSGKGTLILVQVPFSSLSPTK